VKKFIAYYLVSTRKQGASGLGLEAQRAAVEGYLNVGSWKIRSSPRARADGAMIAAARFSGNRRRLSGCWNENAKLSVAR
jgi:hypothetical protein